MGYAPSARRSLLHFQAGFFALLIFSTIITGVGSAAIGTSFVKISRDGMVRAHMEIVVAQNITAQIPGFKLPIINTSLDSSNGSQAISLIKDAILSKSPDTQVNSVLVHIATTDWDSLLQQQSIRVTLDLQLRAVSGSSGNFLLVTTGWKSFVVQSEIKAMNSSVNRIGQSYLESGFLAIKNLQLPINEGLSWYREGVIVAPTDFLNAVPNVTLLDFSGLSTPVENWHSSFDLTGSSTIWSMSNKNFNLTVVHVITLSTGETQRAAYVAQSFSKMQVQAPGTAQAQGDTIRIDTTNGFIEQIMFGVIISLVTVLAVGYVIDRRLTARRPMKKRQPR